MRTIFLLLFVGVMNGSAHGQNSKVRSHANNNTDISVTQSGGDSVQKSEIDADSNEGGKIHVEQGKKTASPTEQKKTFWGRVMDLLTNLNTIVGLVVALVTVGGYLVFKKQP